MSKQTILDCAASLGLTVADVFVPFSQSRNKDEAKNDASRLSLNWKVTLRKGERDILTADYSAGCGHCPSYKPMVRLSIDEYNAIKFECERGRKAHYFGTGFVDGQPILPDDADVIYALCADADALDYARFEDWASNYGFDPDSRKAEQTYQQCLAYALALRNALGEDGLRQLRAACQDY